MSADSSKEAAVRGWGPIQGVVFGYFLYKVPSWIMQGIAPFIVPLLPFSDNLQNFVLFGMFEALVLLCMYAVMRLYDVTWRDLGLGTIELRYAGLALVGFCSYFVLTVAINYLVQSFVHIPDEAQDIGFTRPSGTESVLVFLMLTTLVPFVEESLFRDFLFRGVRKSFSFPVTAIVVSVLFALAHGQLNVGLDVFALSLVLCYLREKTSSLWPGLMLHGLKNAVAFFFLFVYNK